MKFYNIKTTDKFLRGLILKRYKEIIIVLSNGKFYAIAKRAIKSITLTQSVSTIEQEEDDNQRI
jgi:hypothetical protein